MNAKVYTWMVGVLGSCLFLNSLSYAQVSSGARTPVSASSSVRVSPVTTTSMASMTPIIMVDLGRVDFTRGTTGKVYVRSCPTNFTPYVVFVPYKVQSSSPEFHVCVTSVTPVSGASGWNEVNFMRSQNTMGAAGAAAGGGVAAHYFVYCAHTSARVPAIGRVYVDTSGVNVSRPGSANTFYDSTCYPPQNMPTPYLLEAGVASGGTFATSRSCETGGSVRWIAMCSVSMKQLSVTIPIDNDGGTPPAPETPSRFNLDLNCTCSGVGAGYSCSYSATGSAQGARGTPGSVSVGSVNWQVMCQPT